MLEFKSNVLDWKSFKNRFLGSNITGSTKGLGGSISVLSGKTILVSLKHGEWGKEKKSLIKVKKVSVITVAKVVTTNYKKLELIEKIGIVEGVWRKFY